VTLHRVKKILSLPHTFTYHMTEAQKPTSSTKASKNFKETVYDCPELKPNAGIPEERFDAYKLPSRFGNELRYPDGRVEYLGE
jgi:hypothetical protein